MNQADRYKVKWSTRFKKEYQLAMKRGYNIELLDDPPYCQRRSTAKADR